MNFENASILWASKKFDIPLDEIKSVQIEHRKGVGGCDTCDYGGECSFEVIIQKLDKTYTFKELEVDLSTLLNELLTLNHERRFGKQKGW